MNDIIPPNKKRSIRDIPIPSKHSKKKETIVEVGEHENRELDTQKHHKKDSSDDVNLHHSKEYYDEEDETDLYEKKSNKDFNTEFYKRNSAPKKFILLIVFIAILLFFLVLSFRSGAEVTVNPKISEATINAELQANREVGDGSLSFTVDSVSLSVSETVTATGEEEVTEKATGKITIFNEYSENAQRLITQTRFESPDGKVFRIQNSLSVPGYTTDSAGEIIPGTITASVVADEAGESFNIGATSFTIPGFAGQPQFDTMSARSETAMAGGFDGVRKFVEEDEKERLEGVLQEKAKTMMSSEVAVINPDVYAFSTTSLESYVLEQDGSGDDLTFTLKGEAKVLLFNKKEFANAIAVSSIAAFDSEKEQVSLDMNEELSVVVTPLITPGSDREVESATVSLEGRTSFKWIINTSQLANSLTGTERKTFRNILESVPGIQKAEVTIRPFWKNSFPENAEKIDIIVAEE